MSIHHIKGFVFGALVMLITPALAITGDPVANNTPSITDTPTIQYFRLTYADAEEAIGHALTDRGAGGKIAANIMNNNGEYVFSHDKPIAVEIRGLKFDASTHRFSANMVAVSGSDVVSVKAVSGRFDEVIEVPVLKHSVRAGEIIKESDLEFRDYTTARARSDTITDMASLIGKSPERVISAGRPIREQEIAQPSVVKKNDLVKMVFQNGAMQISTNGQALQDGHKGSIITVRNIASKKTVQATVLNASTVVISDQAMQTASAGGVYAN